MNGAIGLIPEWKFSEVGIPDTEKGMLCDFFFFFFSDNFSCILARCEQQAVCVIILWNAWMFYNVEASLGGPLWTF